MNIVIVDDHPIVTETLKLVLISDLSSTEVLTYASGLAFLEDFYDKQMPDILIIDILLPGMTGMELIEELKKRHNNKLPYILILSAINDAHTIKRATQLGASCYLSKGISMGELIKTLRAVYTP